MKTKIISLILILLSIIITAQNFSQEFENNVSLEARKYTITTHDTGYLVGFSIRDLPTNDFRRTLKLITTDFNGNIQNTKIYQAVDSDYSLRCSQVLVLSDGSKIVSGVYSINNDPPYYPYIMRINTDDSIAWAKKIDTNRSRTTLKLLSDNSILLIFEFADPTTHKIFCKLDTDTGDFTTVKEANGLFGQIMAIKTYDTSFEILFVTKGLLNINNDLSAINWQRNYYNEIGSIFNRTANGDYIYASAQTAFPGYMTVFRTDANGTLIWAKYIESWNGPVQDQIHIFDIVGFHFIKEDSNGNITVCADSEGSSNGALNVILDANGNYIDNYKIETFKNEIIQLDNDQYLIGGFLNSASHSTANFILEKRNLTTTYNCDTTYSHSIVDGVDLPLIPETIILEDITFETEDINVALLGIETISQNDYCDMSLSANENILLENLVEVYPNPTNDKVWVESDRAITQIKLYNYLGQYLEISNESFIDMNKYAKGVYFLEVQITNEHIIVKKIIKD